MKIREGRPEDAEFLAEVVLEAIGHELSVGLAGSEERLPLVKKLFKVLAGLSDSQYSYINALIAVDNDGSAIGGIISYDGERLHQLRKAFAREAANMLGWNISEKDSEQWEDEADSGEIYIDSLYVIPNARRRGVASALLEEVKRKFKDSGKPLGLLAEPENKIALKTYENLGFKKVGISNFFRTPMYHLQIPSESHSQDNRKISYSKGNKIAGHTFL